MSGEHRPIVWPIDREDWPVHQPGPAYDAPIPGVHWYAGCEPGGDYDSELGRYTGSGPRVDPATSRCEGCGELACGVCGRERCPDHSYFSFHGWEDESDPPEPGKSWLTLLENGEEIAVIVHRESDNPDDAKWREDKEVRAARIVAALNAASLRGEWTNPV